MENDKLYELSIQVAEGFAKTSEQIKDIRQDITAVLDRLNRIETWRLGNGNKGAEERINNIEGFVNGRRWFEKFIATTAITSLFSVIYLFIKTYFFDKA